MTSSKRLKSSNSREPSRSALGTLLRESRGRDATARTAVKTLNQAERFASAHGLMIEFKAECGHTVRAKDEDAGKVVRCAYCGREAPVPQDEQDELDFLFSPAAPGDSASSADQDTGQKSGKRRSEGMPFPARSRAGTDPFLVVKRMAYVAAVLICVIFVGKKYAWPALDQAFMQDEKPAERTKDFSVARPKKQKVLTKKPQNAGRKGFLTERLDQMGREGVHVRSIPGGATVYFTDAESGSADLKWIGDPNTHRVDEPASIDLSPGNHVLVVTLPINHMRLKEYSGFGYNDLRHKVEEDPQRSDATVDEYFRPDAASEVRVVVLRERIYVARKYDVTVLRNDWSVLTPQFLPYQCELADLHKLVPREVTFGFSENNILGELDFYGVAVADRQYVLDILRRTGSISYRGDSGQWRMFKIDPVSGDFAAPKLSHVRRRRPGRLP